MIYLYMIIDHCVYAAYYVCYTVRAYYGFVSLHIVWMRLDALVFGRNKMIT